MGDLLHFFSRAGVDRATTSARGTFDNEVDRLCAMMNAAKVVIHLVEASTQSNGLANAQAIELGNRIIRALALLDLSPPATAEIESEQLHRVEDIRMLLNYWQRMLGKEQK